MVKKEKINWDKRYREDRGELDDMSIYTKNPAKKEKIIEFIVAISKELRGEPVGILEIPFSQIISNKEFMKELREELNQQGIEIWTADQFVNYLAEKYEKLPQTNLLPKPYKTSKVRKKT